MKILEIYQKYHNMPQLVEHQLRVAAVAGLLISKIPGPSLSAEASAKAESLILDREAVIKACLLHDIGNIVKFDFEYTQKHIPEFLDSESLSYWESIKKEYASKYGTSSHKATMGMVREIGLNKEVADLIDSIGFSQAEENAAAGDFDRKICAYSDMRVEPTGVVSLEERFLGLRQRYKDHREGEAERERFENALRKIEQQIFEHSSIKPQDLTEQAIAPFVERLRNYEI